MFGLGMGELLVILAIALIFLGPKRLPDVATSLGKAIRSFKKATSELADQLEVEDAIKQPIRELKAALRDEPAQSVNVNSALEAKVAMHANVAARKPVAASTPPPVPSDKPDEPPRGA